MPASPTCAASRLAQEHRRNRPTVASQAGWSEATVKKPCPPGRADRANHRNGEQLSRRLICVLNCRLNELLVLRRSLQRHRRGLTVGDGLGDLVKVACADKPLVPDRSVAAID